MCFYVPLYNPNSEKCSNLLAFIPETFPSKTLLDFPKEVLTKAVTAERLIGKLDGITHVLPYADLFISMFIVKDATSSSQIEGTKAAICLNFNCKAPVLQTREQCLFLIV